MVAASCSLLCLAGGCGSKSGEATTAEDPTRALANWYQGVEAAVAKMEAKQRGFTQFRVAQAPAKSDLLRLSAAGVRAGETADDSASQLFEATTLTEAEAAGLYCYFFAYYVDIEFFPDREDFEEVIYNLVKAELKPSATAAEVHESADALRASMIESERVGGEATKVAAGTFC